MSFARIPRVVLGLVAAIVSALIFLPIATLVDPVTRGAGADLTAAAFLTVLERALSDQGPGQVLMLILAAVRSVAVILCGLPVVVVGLIGETAKVGSGIWYSMATGVLTAAIPYMARSSGDGRVSHAAHGVEIRFATILFLTGAVAGLIYWLAAGRSAQPKVAEVPQPVING
jgi:hypothetical protein